jgi:hypothetical protein
MANRFTTHVLKNSDIVNRPLPSSLLAGEPIINTADGVMYMSGVTSSTNEWTPAGTGTTANFFEVGSNLYDLRLRNKITKYEGASGGGLVGKFLSGTTSGFVLADIADIATSTDSYVTGGTYNSTSDEITLSLNLGKPNVVITGIGDTFTTGSTLIGNTAYFNTNTALSAYTLDLSALDVNDTYVTGGTYNPTTSTLGLGLNNNTNLAITGITNGKLKEVLLDAYNGTRLDPINTSLNGFHISKAVNGNVGYSVFNSDDAGNGAMANFTAKGSGALYTNNTGISHFGANYFIPYLRGNGALYSDKNLFIAATGGSNKIEFRTGVDLATATSKLSISSGGILSVGVKPTVDNAVTNLLGRKSDGTVVVVESSGLTDTYVTGYNYNPASNTFTITRNNAQPNLTTSFDTVSGLSVSNLTAGRVVYVGAGGELVDEAGFTYNTGTNVFSVPLDGGMNVGSAGLNVAGDTVIQGSLTVFGPAVSAFTSQLYVEDPNIEINYNPTGSTTSTSVGAGVTIQDGNGLTGGSVSLSIREMQGLTGLTGTEIPDVTEYTSGTGYENRGFVTELNDIVIRSANITTPSGVRVLAEFDILDGGTY